MECVVIANQNIEHNGHAFLSIPSVTMQHNIIHADIPTYNIAVVLDWLTIFFLIKSFTKWRNSNSIEK